MDDRLRAGARAARGLRGSELVDALLAVPFVDRDAWVDELLGLPPPPADGPLPRGAVPYLPCPVDDVLAFVRDASLGPADQLVDVGSGVGRALVLAHLVSGAPGVGIEIQDHLVAEARALTARLGISSIAFTEGDFTSMELDGSHFFLFAPCNGELLARLVERLAALARRRPITIGTAGFELEAPWLVRVPSSCGALAIYRASPGVLACCAP